MRKEAKKLKEYNCYIDESGDEGIHKGSKYFILTAILVEKQKDLGISKCVDNIKENIEINIKNQLHWKLIKGYPNKIMIMQTINEMDITIINIVIDTRKIKFIKSDEIYNHFFGYLCERITWFAKDKNALVNINISSRGNLSKDTLLGFIKSNTSKFKIDYKRIKDLKIYSNAQKKLLQLADCCCSALGQALKYNDVKHQKYVSYLVSKYYTSKAKYLGYGLKYVPGKTKYPKEFQDLLNYLSANKK